MNNLYVHKNIIKKIKRDHYLIEKVLDFISNFHDYTLGDQKGIELISNNIYEGKLLYKKNIVFDIPMDGESFVIWDIYQDNSGYESKEIHYDYRNLKELIEGNQFIKRELNEGQAPTELFEQLKESKSTELDYCLDSKQQEILYKFNHLHQKNQAITGPAGAGKTLMLNRLAYESIKNQQPFMYIAFTSTLKDKFLNFIHDALQNHVEFQKNHSMNVEEYACVYTYEEFLRDYMAPKLHLVPDVYVLFNECSVFIKTKLDRFYQGKRNLLGLSLNDLTRILMSMSISDEPGDGVKTISNRIKKLESNKEILISDMEKELIFSLETEFEDYVKNKLNKKLWKDFIIDIKNALIPNKEYVYQDCILIDEMQDLSQAEFDLLENIIKNTSYEKKKFILAFDANQRISLDGSSERNLNNRLDFVPVSLKYSYRNSYNILNLSNYFLDASKCGRENTKEDLKSNINSNKIKILVENDLNHVILHSTKKFIPEENLNIGILAYGKTYEDIKGEFIDEQGKSKYIGIEFFNEEQIKGLEFSNLIILDFMELYRTKRIITDMDLRKWYVGITRASENLMLHFSCKQDLDILVDHFKEVLHKNDLIQDNDSILDFDDCEEAFDCFKKDLLVSLGDEQKTLFLNEANNLMIAYEEKLDVTLLEDSIDLFYKTNSIHTLINLLERLSTKTDYIYLELIKALIVINDKRKINRYIQNVNHQDFWKITEFAAKHHPLIVPFLSELINVHHHLSKDFALERLRKTIHDLEMNGEFDKVIYAYNNEGMFEGLISYYEKLHYRFNEKSLKYIGRAYQKTNKLDEAISFYLKHDKVMEAVRLYELLEKYHDAYQICRDALLKDYNKQLLEKALDISLKLYDEEILKDMMMISERYNDYDLDHLNFEMYILTNDIEYLITAINLSYKNQKYKSVIRYYKKEKTFLHNEPSLLKQIAHSFEKESQIFESAQLYKEIKQFDKATELFYSNGDHSEVAAICDFIRNDLTENSYIEFASKNKRYLVQSLVQEERIPDVLDFCVFLSDIPKAIEIAFKYKLFSKVISIYEQAQSLDYQSDCYLGKDKEKVKSDLYKSIAVSYDQTRKYEQSAYIYNHFLGCFFEAIVHYNKAKNTESVITLFETKYNHNPDDLRNNPSRKEFITKIFKRDYHNWNMTDETMMSKVGNEKFDELIEIIFPIYQERNESRKLLNVYLLSENRIYVSEIISLYYEFKEYQNLIDIYEGNKAALNNRSKLYIAKAYEQIELHEKAKVMYLQLLKSATAQFKKYKKILKENLNVHLKPEYSNLGLENRRIEQLEEEDVPKKLLTQPLSVLFVLRDQQINELSSLTFGDLLSGKGTDKYLKKINTHLESLLINRSFSFKRDDIQSLLTLFKNILPSMTVKIKHIVTKALYTFLLKEIIRIQPSSEGIKYLIFDKTTLDCLNLLKSEADLNEILIKNMNHDFLVEVLLLTYKTVSNYELGSNELDKEGKMLQNEKSTIQNNLDLFEKEILQIENKVLAFTGREEQQNYQLSDEEKQELTKLLDKKRENEKKKFKSSQRLKELDELLKENENKRKEHQGKIKFTTDLAYEFLEKNWILFLSEFTSAVSTNQPNERHIQINIVLNKQRGVLAKVEEVLTVEFNEYFFESDLKAFGYRQENNETKIMEKETRGVALNMEIQEEDLKRIEKQAMIKVIKRAFNLGTIETEILSELTGISVNEIETMKLILSMDRDELKVLID